MSQTEPLKNFLDPKTVSKITDFRLLVRLIVDGFFMGAHRGPKQAFSLEYSKHRDYYPGDPLKRVDWRLFGKTDRHFVKQYEEETNLEAWLVVDISKSMSYQGSRAALSKLRYAACLAGAIAHWLLGQKDLVGLILFDSRVRKIIPPSSTNRQLAILLKELCNLKEGEESQFEHATRHAASRIKRRGLIMLFSDLLTDPDQIEKTLRYFLHRGNELIVFHTLAHEELEFPFKRFGFFEDMETKQKILLQPEYLREEYCKQMKECLERIKKTCMRMKVHYEQIETTTPFDKALMRIVETRKRLY